LIASARETTPARVLVVTHSYYEEDPRVRRQAEALAAAGFSVDVLALQRPGSASRERLEGVDVHRLPVQRHQGAGIRTYLGEYAEFFARVALAAVPLHARRRYAVAQVATLPDPLVFALAPLRLDGVPLVLDLHEAMPEFFRSRFPAASRGLIRAALLAAERASIGVASHVLTVNDALRDRLEGLGVPASKVTVILNSPRADRFDPSAHPRRAFRADGCLRLVYAGALTPLYQLDVVVDALARLARGDGGPAIDARLDLYGRGDAETLLRERAAALGVGDRVTFHGRIPVEEVPARLAEADVGIAPTRRDAFTDFSLSTKIFEYAAMGKPVIASRLPTVERYFGPDALCYFEPGDGTSLAAAVRRVADDAAYRDAIVAAAGQRVRELSWEREAERYVDLVASQAAGAR
jgi:glycosyltransferase involved in cell wall biosynthesis